MSVVFVVLAVITTGVSALVQRYVGRHAVHWDFAVSLGALWLVVFGPVLWVLARRESSGE